MITQRLRRLDALREQLASIEHERWAHWQRYLHGLCERTEDGRLVIPAASVEHWERQIATPYVELTEREKASDREQVARYWPLVEVYLRRAALEEAADDLETQRPANVRIWLRKRAQALGLRERAGGRG